MKTFGLFLCLSLLLTSTPSHGSGWLNQELVLRIDPEKNQLKASAILSSTERSADLPAVYHLAGHANIESLSADGKALSYTFSDGLLKILGTPSFSSLTINYTLRFDDPVPQDIVGIEDPSYGVSATILQQGSYLSSGSGWHPRVDEMKSLFQVKITGPRGLTGVTSGHMVEHSTTETETVTVWKTRFPQFNLALAAGHYQIDRTDLGEIQLLTFLREENASLAEGYLESSRQYLQLYQKLFGPYPYSKFAVVENFYPTGYGLPGWTLLGSRVIKLPFIRTTSLPHEIAHAWWGNAIEIDYARGNWGEGLATYVADYLIKEQASPEEALEYRRKILRDYAALIDKEDDLALVDFRSRKTRLDQAVGYGKSALVFHMLRDLIGDEAFWAGLKSAATEGISKRYGWDDLQRHFQAITEIELAPFFRQWLDRSGAPKLSLTEVAVLQTASGWQVSGNISQDPPVYDLAIPLHLQTESRSYQQVVGLSQRQDCFVFTVAEQPFTLSVDPESRLFRQLYPEELPATVNHLRASKSPLVVVATGADALLEASRDLLHGLQWHQAEVISEDEYLTRIPVKADILIIGQPKSPTLRPELPLGRSPSIEVDDAVFWVMKSASKEQVMGGFLPGSLAAAQDTARRIPHYGRYSYLTFRNGHNQQKLTWEPKASPLKVTFDHEVSL